MKKVKLRIVYNAIVPGRNSYVPLFIKASLFLHNKETLASYK